MKNYKDFEKNLIEIESLVEIIKAYCQYKSEESEELSNLSILLDIVSRKQKAMFNKFDKMCLEDFS